MLSRGAQVHGYEVWGKLGEGGMSEVWLAKHAVLNVPVVIKTLRRAIVESVGDAGAQRMFDEARLMARVTSGRVVRAVDAGTVDGTPYLVEEYVDGVDMAELDRARRGALGVGLPLWTVCRVMEETCQALHAAHQAGVIHRDVKPSNLFAAPETGIRLGDFGIAVARGEGPPVGISGTLRFMAPEQLRGEPADRASDAYSAGATAFDLRYGHPPFEDASTALDDSMAPAFPPPHGPGEAYFQEVVRGMLSKRKADRPQELCVAAAHFRNAYQALRPAEDPASLVALDRCHYRFQGCDITFRAGDIADEAADAIVTSARFDMSMRSGVGEAVRRRGGDQIEREAMSGGGRALGECVETAAGALKARWVLHAVSAWNQTSCVGRATLRAIAAADRLGLRTLAFPALGTGAARVSLETCANAMGSALRWRLQLGGSRLRAVSFVLGDEAKLATFRDVAVGALRGGVEVVRPADVGLPDDGRAVTAESATCLDPSSGAPPPDGGRPSP